MLSEFSSNSEREREREMKTNYMKKLQFHFIQNIFHPYHSSDAHICTNIYNKQSMYGLKFIVLKCSHESFQNFYVTWNETACKRHITNVHKKGIIGLEKIVFRCK